MSSQHHHCDNDLNSGSSRSRSTATASARLLLRQQRQRYRESLQLSPHQKASMLCAVLGELRWFGARTRPTHRTHNNAIFPPSDVLILHVLATHLVECLPAEMLLMALEPHLAAIQSQWQNFPMSLPTQLLTRFTPQPARYRLADVPTTNNNTTPITTAAQVSLPRLDLDGPPEQGFSGHQPPSSRAFATRMHPTIVVPVLQGSGCRSAALRRHVRAKLEVERDDWLWKKSTKDGPQSTSTSTTPPAATTFSTEEAPAQPQPLSSEQTDVPPSPSPPRAAMMSVDRLKELLSRVRAGEAALQKE